MDEPRLIIERNVEAAMRDGTVLRADVYRPDTPDRLPVLLQRTPYGKQVGGLNFAILSAGRGYAVVVQDTRGRWASDGEHYPMRDEFEDGYDTVEWAASQPWANGKVGMWGGSYVGWTQWAAAAMAPPSLEALFPSVTFMDFYRDAIVPGGALAQGVAQSWGLVAGTTMSIMRSDAPAEAKAARMQELADALDGLSRGSTPRVVPVEGAPMLSPGDFGALHDWVAHRTKDAYWDQMDIRPRIGKIAVPAYHLGGWYDIFCGGTLDNYVQMLGGAATAQARAGQKLIMGPWLHGPLNGVVGEFDFGVRASEMFVLSMGIMWRWFDHWLKGEANGIMDEPSVRLFVMGANAWRDEDEWPLARTVYTPCYLRSDGNANGLSGDGALSMQAPTDEPSDAFTYDPRDPVPTRGGGLCCYAPALPAGAYDQREIEVRDDVLVYTSPPLEQDLEVTGPLKVVLWAASSAVDTDFTAKLVDVGACGYARNVADGILRARYRVSVREEHLLTPGAIERYEIDLAGTSNLFLAGHRIRLEVSSSNFPRFERNPNTCEPVASEEEMVPARQTVYHDAGHPSHILLPVIPG